MNFVRDTCLANKMAQIIYMYMRHCRRQNLIMSFVKKIFLIIIFACFKSQVEMK